MTIALVFILYWIVLPPVLVASLITARHLSQYPAQPALAGRATFLPRPAAGAAC